MFLAFTVAKIKVKVSPINFFVYLQVRVRENIVQAPDEKIKKKGVGGKGIVKRFANFETHPAV